MARPLGPPWGEGGTGEGSFVDSKPHGPWIFREPDGTVTEGSYVDGQRHGPWINREADGEVASEETYVNGQLQRE